MKIIIQTYDKTAFKTMCLSKSAESASIVEFQMSFFWNPFRIRSIKILSQNEHVLNNLEKIIVPCRNDKIQYLFKQTGDVGAYGFTTFGRMLYKVRYKIVKQKAATRVACDNVWLAFRPHSCSLVEFRFFYSDVRFEDKGYVQYA